MKHWYAIHCKPRQDARAAQHLENQRYTVFRPLARTRKLSGTRARYRVDSLFPRYLFIHLDDTGESWAPIRSTRGVAGLVALGRGRAPTVVPDGLIDGIRAQLGEAGWVDLADDEYARHDPVRIVDGAFAGFEALFEARTAAERVVVLLNLLGAERRIEVPAAAVVKA